MTQFLYVAAGETQDGKPVQVSAYYARDAANAITRSVPSDYNFRNLRVIVTSPEARDWPTIMALAIAVIPYEDGMTEATYHESITAKVREYAENRLAFLASPASGVRTVTLQHR